MPKESSQPEYDFDVLRKLKEDKDEIVQIRSALNRFEEELKAAVGLERPSLKGVQESPLPKEMDWNNPGVAVTLIHGTFAPKATWTQRNSNLRRFLSRTIKQGVTFNEFQWSGSNNFGARKRAADRLRDHLEKELSDHPEADHYIIAHSHGGNIALQACDWKFNDKIKGIIFLNTPFLRVGARAFGVLGLSAMFALVFLLIMIAPVLVAASLLDPNWYALGALSMALAYPSLKISRRVVPWYLEEAHKAAEKYNSSSGLGYERISSFLIRESSDEATGVLTLVSTLNWLMAYTLQKVTSMFRVVYYAMEWVRYLNNQYFLHWPRLVAFIVFAFCVLVSLPMLAWFREFLPLMRWPLLLSTIFVSVFLVLEFLPFVLVAAGYLLEGILTLPVLFASSLVMWSFGKELLLFGLALEVTVEATPVGKWQVFQINAPYIGAEIKEHTFRPKPGLRHSRIYENPAALYAIGSFIAGGAGAVPTHIALRTSLKGLAELAEGYLDSKLSTLGTPVPPDKLSRSQTELDPRSQGNLSAKAIALLVELSEGTTGSSSWDTKIEVLNELESRALIVRLDNTVLGGNQDFPSAMLTHLGVHELRSLGVFVKNELTTWEQWKKSDGE